MTYTLILDQKMYLVIQLFETLEKSYDLMKKSRSKIKKININ